MEAVIVSAVRTPLGKFGGSLKDFSAPELGSFAIKGALEKVKDFITVEDIDEVIMGNVLQAGIGQAPARQAALKSGIPVEVPAVTINKVCGSGLKAVTLAAQAIKAGDAKIIVAGGQENMSRTPYYLPKARFGYRYGTGRDAIVDGLEFDGLREANTGILMGLTGEIVAERNGITRAEADQFSYRSHQLAIKAQNSGALKDEIVPITIRTRKESYLLDLDEGPRKDTSVESLARLRPVFKEDGIVTAGNASTLNDGAAATIIMERKTAQELGIEPLATIKAYNSVGVEPNLLMEAPIKGTKKLFEDLKLTIDDIDVFEHNEAFATASVAVQKAFNIPDEIFNPRGGAVSLGHPLGTSGTRILVTLLSELIRKDGERGLATICLGGGNAVTILIER